MPTENVKFGPGKFFIQDKEGKAQEIGELTQFEINSVENNDAVDALRYSMMREKEEKGTMSITITKESSRRLQKMLGIERITRKRFIKLLMGCGIQRNQAEKIAKIAHKNNMKYTPILVQEVIEIILRELKKL